MAEKKFKVKIMKIAHIINSTEINDSKEASYLYIAQPLTMRSMIIAKKTAKSVIDVELVLNHCFLKKFKHGVISLSYLRAQIDF